LESQQQLVYGVVDFSDMALGDVHQEFQYMDSFRPWNAERIIHLYEALSGRVLSRERIKLYSAWTALGHAAFATEAPAARALASKHQWVERVAKQGGVGMS
jgi:aminoglycoside phosphotransferase (APT) family kinase protein